MWRLSSFSLCPLRFSERPGCLSGCPSVLRPRHGSPAGALLWWTSLEPFRRSATRACTRQSRSNCWNSLAETERKERGSGSIVERNQLGRSEVRTCVHSRRGRSSHRHTSEPRGEHGPGRQAGAAGQTRLNVWATDPECQETLPEEKTTVMPTLRR